MIIKPVTKENLEACANVYIKAYSHAPWNYDWKLDAAINYLNEYISSEQFIGFVIFDDGDIAGALLAHTRTWWTNNQLYIDEFFISPASQKKGFGKLLLNHAEEYARNNDLGVITLLTNKYMPVMKFYDSNNFIHAQPFVMLFKKIKVNEI